MFEDLKHRFICMVVTLTYGVLYLFVSQQLANFLLVIAVLLFIVYLISSLFAENIFNDKKVFFLPKKFVFDKNTIFNENCTVKYFKDVKIIVFESVANAHGEKRMFTLTHSSSFDVNQCWGDICGIFDEYLTIDSLAAFVKTVEPVVMKTIGSSVKNTSTQKTSEKVLNIDASKNGPKFVEMNQIQPDPYTKNTNHQRAYDSKFVNIENVDKVEKTVERKIEEPPLVEMGDALSVGPNKIINVNEASASEISILPGINIVIAKKIVEYRDKNGQFNSVDDFIRVANIKEHFVQNVKKMVVVKPSNPPSSDNSDGDDSRIVDL